MGQKEKSNIARSILDNYTMIYGKNFRDILKRRTLIRKRCKVASQNTKNFWKWLKMDLNSLILNTRYHDADMSMYSSYSSTKVTYSSIQGGVYVDGL